MRHFVSVLVFGALALAGCQFDPVAACESRCEERKALGCEPSGTRCDNACVLADDVYDEGYDRAAAAGCTSQYQATMDCAFSTPACATEAVIAERCAEEYLILQNCL